MIPRQLYAIVDHKAEDILGPIIIARANAVAVRIFTDLVKSDQNDVGQHPEDFTLVQLGTLNADLTITPENRDIITGNTVRELIAGAIAEQQNKGRV